MNTTHSMVGVQQHADHFSLVEQLESRQMFSLAPVVPDFPIITFNSTGVINYDVQTGQVDVTATPTRIRMASTGGIRNITGLRSFEMHAVVDSAGQLLGGVAGDDLKIVGDIDIDGNGTIDFSGDLLTGEVQTIGFEDSGTVSDQFEFTFYVTGGQLATYFAGKDVGSTVLSENSTFANGFATSFIGGAKGSLGSVAQIFSLPPEIQIVKSGPVVAKAGEALTYQYEVTNPLELAPLSNVTVIDDKAGPAIYVSGDTDGDQVLELGETWLFSATYTPQFDGAVLTNIATATGFFRDMQALDQDSFNLNPVTLNKKLFLYWNSAQCNVAYTVPDGTQFDVQVSKDGAVIGTVSVAQGQSQSLWLSDGAYTFEEIDLPDGYLACQGPVSLATGQGASELTLANVATFDLSVTKTGPANATPGQTIKYTYTVESAGPAAVTPVLQDDKTGAPRYVSGDDDNDGLIDADETWVFQSCYTVPSKQPGATTYSSYGSYCCQCPPPPANWSLTNTVVVSAAQTPKPARQWLLGGDTDASNNTAMWTVQVGKATIVLGSLSGSVFLDWNNDGRQNCLDFGLPSIKLTLTGVDDRGYRVTKTTYTDCRGSYKFSQLRPGTYTISQDQPCWLTSGIERVGTLGGRAINDRLTNIVLESGDNGTGYNFGQRLRCSIFDYLRQHCA